MEWICRDKNLVTTATSTGMPLTIST